MKVIRTVGELRAALARAHREGRSVGLVPTMGAFHEGHLSLIRRARADCDVVVVSLFVNPAQFAPSEDLAAYPRDEARDAALAEAEGADILFAPPVEEVYPPGFSVTVEVGGLTEVLCGDPGRRGPEHFHGVTTVVTKLFNMVGPDVAYFGQKDAQQALVIRKLVRDLDMPVRIEVLPTVREPDGLALSSRNRYLSPDERRTAPALFASLRQAAESIREGWNVNRALDMARAALTDAGFVLDYVEARHAETLAPVEGISNAAPLRLLTAARMGTTRLIDNIAV